jgi:hypothetical protein
MSNMGYAGLLSDLNDVLRGGIGVKGDVKHPKAEREPLLGTDRFAVDKYRMGVARLAIGKPAEDRYPLPFGKDVPAQVKPVADRWLAEVVTKAIAGDETSRQIVREAKIAPAMQVQLWNRLKYERQLASHGLSAEAAKARAWSFQGDPNERKPVTSTGVLPKRLVTVE